MAFGWKQRKKLETKIEECKWQCKNIEKHNPVAESYLANAFSFVLIVVEVDTRNVTARWTQIRNVTMSLIAKDRSEIKRSWSDNGHVKQMGKQAMYASHKRWNRKVAENNYIEVKLTT